ncbi:MAG: 30S ribosomal protein S2, partial [Bacteroidota bacterium]
MNTLTIQQLFDAGVHYGHLSKKWNPSFKPFIFMKKGDYHLIDVKKTLIQLQEAGEALKALLAKGEKVLFVGCKKQASPVVTHVAKALDQPYVTKRWLGGTLTNFATFRKRLKELATLKTTEEAPKESKRYLNLTKKERLIEDRTKKKQASLLGGMTVLKRLPSALFVVDVNLECTAVREAKKLGLPIFAIVDSNASPDPIDYPIACNDDKRSAIKLVLDYLAIKMAEGNELWTADKANRDNTMAQENEGEGQPQLGSRKRIGGIQTQTTTTPLAGEQPSDPLAIMEEGQPSLETEGVKAQKGASTKLEEQKEGVIKVTAKATTTAKTTQTAPKEEEAKPAVSKEGQKTIAKAATTAKTTQTAPKEEEAKPAVSKEVEKTIAKAATTAKTTQTAPKEEEAKPA